LSQKYLHFTDLAGAEGIKKSNSVWQSSYGPMGAVFAVAVGGAWVPGVQMSSMGRAKTRSTVVVFETELLPDYAMPEEVMWHVGQLPVKVVRVITPAQAKILLDSSIPEDGKTEMLKIKLHPAFNVGGDWTRMPKNFSPWIPGKDNEKYDKAFHIWKDTKDTEQVKIFWETNKSQSALSDLINFYANSELENT